MIDLLAAYVFIWIYALYVYVYIYHDVRNKCSALCYE
jgi:hypothetical protein